MCPDILEMHSAEYMLNSSAAAVDAHSEIASCFNGNASRVSGRTKRNRLGDSNSNSNTNGKRPTAEVKSENSTYALRTQY